LTLEEFEKAAHQGNLVPIHRELLLDADTPVSAFAKLAGAGEHPFLLESVVGGETWAAYSFIGVGARAVATVQGGQWRVRRFDVEAGGEAREESGAASDPAEVLARVLADYRPAPAPGLPRFWGGAVGFFSYDAVRAFERLPALKPDELGVPDALFVITDTLVIFDNLRQTVKVVASALTDGDPARAYASACRRIDAIVERLGRPAPALAPLDPRTGGLEPSQGSKVDVQLLSSTPRHEFLAAVDRAKEYILSGDVFQVVLSQRFSAPRDGADPFDVYRALRVVNPSPYMFHLAFPEVQVTGASPEVLVRVENGRAIVRPIAGTRPRGATPDEDARLEAELRADPKELAEHLMLIDLGRNDVGRVARVGTVRVDEQFVIERYSHVMHLVSHVSGELEPARAPLDVLRACFPAGTLSGAPKIRAMEIIEELEPARRGIYGGAVGYVSFSGNLDFAIAIRTLVTRGDRVYLQAGAGIVADSDPAAEFDETVNKARAVMRALAMARGPR
jgi:anthranilate synthase component 1